MASYNTNEGEAGESGTVHPGIAVKNKHNGHWHETVLDAIAEGICCVHAAPPYSIRFINPYAARLLGIDPAEVIGQPLDSVLSIQADTVKGVEGALELLKPHNATALEAEVYAPGRLEGFTAALTIAQAGLTQTGTGPQEEMLVLTIQDVSQKRLNEQHMRLSGKVFEVCSEAIMITDISGRIVSVNPAFTWLTGYRPDEVIGKSPRILKSGYHDEAFYADMWSKLLGDGFWSGEIWDRRKDGSLYPKWASINAVREGGRITHFVALAHDISANKEHENRIRHLAEHDTLTGLPNRRRLSAQIEQMIRSGRRADQSFAVVLIDLDRFKHINDTQGHQVGDQVLIEIARRLSQGVRNTDMVARLGGDEFVVLLTDIAPGKELAEVISGLHRRLAVPIQANQRVLHAPPSMGIATYPEDGQDIDTLLRNADAAMYQTKAQGRNGWTFFTAEMNRHLNERKVLEAGLRHAIETNSLSLHYQPLKEVGTGEIHSWEALLRWHHPELGNIAPERLISIAEDSGQIFALGRWVLHTACRQIRDWETAHLGKYRISINLSSCQLEQPDLEATVLEALQCHGLSPDRLELEITESTLLNPSQSALASLLALRKLGVLITLDDFGTGYSSLSYLKTLSVDRVKLDRSFVGNMTLDKGDASIVQAILMLASNLDLAVVAEGVETQEQHAFLHRHGCAEAQGYLLGHPMPAEAVGDFLATAR